MYNTEFRLKLAANKSLKFHITDSEIWASCFSADCLQQHQSCFTCGSVSHYAAHCPLKQPARQPFYTRESKEPRFKAPSAPIQSRLGPRAELCRIFNDQGNCFRGHKCPYTHSCSYCQGPHPHCGCSHVYT